MWRPKTLTLGSALALILLTIPARAAQQMSYDEAKRVIGRIDREADRFKDSFKHAIHHSGLDAATRDNAVRLVKDFESASDTLKHNYNKHDAAVPAAQAVLQDAAAIDEFMVRHPLTTRSQEDWRVLRSSLDQLGTAYAFTWRWPVIVVQPAAPAVAVVPVPGTNAAPGVILEQPRAAVIEEMPYRISHEDMEALMKRIENDADRFRSSLHSAVESSRFDDTTAEARINQYVKDFENSTDNLKHSFSDKNAAVGVATDVLRRAAVIDQFMRANTLTPQAQSDWLTLRRDLDDLAAAYSGTFDWTTITFLPR